MKRRLLVLTALLVLGSFSCAPRAGSVAVPTPTQPPSPSPPSSPAPSSLPETLPPSLTTQANVVRVIDGDTIEVDIAGKLYQVRYLGIDSPEPDKTYGKEALAKNKELVEGKAVHLEKDISETDKYGRLLRYIYVGDLFVNAELVRLGYAQVVTYPPDVKYQSLFLQLQREAREAGRGLWASVLTPTPTPTPKPTLTPTKTPGAVSWDRAKDHIGERITVYGAVVDTRYASSSRGRPTFLNIGKPYPDPGRFTVVIWAATVLISPHHQRSITRVRLSMLPG